MDKLTKEQMTNILSLAECRSEDIEFQYYGDTTTHTAKFISLQELRSILQEMLEDS